MRRLKKILDWFKYDNQKEKELFGFRSHQDGRRLFYPWGHPGESVFVTSKQQTFIIATIIFYWAIWCVYFFGGIYLDNKNVLPTIIGSHLIPLGFVYSGLFYVPLMFLLTRNKPFYIEEKEKRDDRKKAKWYECLFAILLVFGWTIYMPTLFLAFILLLGIALLLWGNFVLQKRKGYFFNK